MRAIKGRSSDLLFLCLYVRRFHTVTGGDSMTQKEVDELIKEKIEQFCDWINTCSYELYFYAFKYEIVILFVGVI